MTHWLVLSAFVAATALGACRSREGNSNLQPSAMPVEQTDPASNPASPANAPPRDSPGAANSNDPWAQSAAPSGTDTAPQRAANPNDPWTQPAPPSPDTAPGAAAPNTATPNTATPNAATPNATTPSPAAPDAKSNTATPTLPFPPPGTAGKTIPPTHPVKPDEPGTVEPDSRDNKTDSSAGSGNRDFGRSP